MTSVDEVVARSADFASSLPPVLSSEGFLLYGVANVMLLIASRTSSRIQYDHEKHLAFATSWRTKQY